MCALPIFDPAPGATGMDDLVRGVAAIASGVAAGTGRVTFVCAGPGDADLLTLRAMRALPAADVILHDARITDEVPIGRASWRARVCQYVLISVVAVALKKKHTKHR